MFAVVRGSIAAYVFADLMGRKTNGQPEGQGVGFNRLPTRSPDKSSGHENFPHKKECEQDLLAWAATRLTPWGKPQKDDYEFRWANDASEERLKAGLVYEYARESHKFRCLLVIDRTPREERFWSAGCPDHPSPPLIEYERRSRDLLKSGWETWLCSFADELIANKSFAELLRTNPTTRRWITQTWIARRRNSN